MASLQAAFEPGVLLHDRYQTVSPLNHGSFGIVFLAQDTHNGEQVAIKCLSKDTNDYTSELECHRRLGKHANIVNVLDSFETVHHLYLVLEYCAMGDLYEAIRHGHGPKETENVRDLMLQLVGAIQHMHANGLFHRDIKPENIFLCPDGAMKLGDLGLATSEAWSHEACVGSDRYMAPEQHDPSDAGYAPAQADVWAMGICLLNVLFARNPFVVPRETDVLYSDFVRDQKSLFDIFPNMSNDTFDVLTAAMAINPAKRSLTGVRAALQKAVAFTTDDDVLDDFCTEERDLIVASADREPLRTPSLSHAPTHSEGAFPWSKALHGASSHRHHGRQLSVIADNESYTEDLFPPSEADRRSWVSLAFNSSVTSGLDSAFGASVKSMALNPAPQRHVNRSRPVPVPSSLPSRISALSSIFGKRDASVSKSWTDMYDEDEEETRSPSPKPTPAEDLPEDDLDESASDVFAFEDSPAPAPAAPSDRTILDKWAALGNRRRQFKDSEPLDQASSTAQQQGKARRSLTSNWRTGFGLKALATTSGNSSAPRHDHLYSMQLDSDRKELAQAKVLDWRRETSPVRRLTPLSGNRPRSMGDFGWDIEWMA